MNNLETLGLLATTSTVADGNMDFRFGDHASVIKNREVFLKRYSVNLEHVVALSVTHGDSVVLVGHGDAGRGSVERDTGVVAEALLTQDTRLTMMLLSADCIPLVLYDPVAKAAALVHAGWKPTVLKLSQKVLAAMEREFGTAPSNVMAYLGPSIRRDSYLLNEVLQKDDPQWRPFIEKRGDQYSVDVIAANTHLLTEAGVLPSRIEVSPEDTASSPRFYSHYRATRTNEPEGRMATIVRLPFTTR